MLVHQIFLHASLLVWGKKVQKKGSRDAVIELTRDLCLLQGLGEGAQPVAAEVFCTSEMPLAKAAKARATKFVGFLSDESTPSCLAVSVTVTSPCTHVHAWLFESQILWHDIPFSFSV